MYTTIQTQTVRGQNMTRTNKLHGVFNKGAYWPTAVEEAIETKLKSMRNMQMELSAHCMERIAQYWLPADCATYALMGEVVEAYFDNGKLYKVVTRAPRQGKKSEDICYAIALRITGPLSITLWLNNRDDNHFTLKTENYAQYKSDSVQVVSASAPRETPAAVFYRTGKGFSNAL